MEKLFELFDKIKNGEIQIDEFCNLLKNYETTIKSLKEDAMPFIISELEKNDGKIKNVSLFKNITYDYSENNDIKFHEQKISEIKEKMKIAASKGIILIDQGSGEVYYPAIKKTSLSFKIGKI